MKQRPLTGLVLTGGGSRGAYQAGAIQAISDICKEIGEPKPFDIMTATSAGAINISYLASRAEDPCAAARGLVKIWENLHTDNIFNIGISSLARLSSKWVFKLLTGGIFERFSKTATRGLLDTSPLWKLVNDSSKFATLHENIEKGILHSMAVTAVNYSSGASCTFYEGAPGVKPWIRAGRQSEKTVLTPAHIIASASIPILFPSVKIGAKYFGDGSLRNHTPLSPPLQLGASRLLVIGVRRGLGADEEVPSFSLGRVISVLINSLMLDAIDLDYERLMRINDTVGKLHYGAQTPLRKVDIAMIRPSEDIGRIAYEEADAMPKTIRYLVNGLGSPRDAQGLISNLLFEPPFAKRLIELGYEDAMRQKERIVEFYTAE